MMAYRIFNSVVAATGLSLIAPLLAAVALAIKCDDGGPVFYVQPGMGRGFRPFGLIKFRTMAVNADQAGLLTAPKDARLTQAGFLFWICESRC